MSGVGVRIDLSDIDSLQVRIERLAKLSDSDLRPLLDDIGETVESQTRRRIEDEKESPSGVPWPDLDPDSDYAKRKVRKSSGGLLEFGGDLLDDINYQVSGRSVEVGTALIYGATHQAGDDERNIKQREYLGLSPDNEEEIVDLIDNFIDRIMLS